MTWFTQVSGVRCLKLSKSSRYLREAYDKQQALNLLKDMLSKRYYAVSKRVSDNECKQIQSMAEAVEFLRIPDLDEVLISKGVTEEEVLKIANRIWVGYQVKPIVMKYWEIACKQV